MRLIKLCETEVVETTRVFEFADGAVTITERETHEFYGPEMASTPRLVIGDAVELTRGFVAKARTEFTQLNTVLRELTAR